MGSPDHARRGAAAQMAAVLFATSLAVVTLNVAPAVEALLRQQAHFTVAQVGTAYFVELAMMGLASVPACWWLGRRKHGRVAQLAYLGFVAGNLGSLVQLHSFWPYVAARAVTGTAAGTLMILGVTAGARSSQLGRIFALITLAQLASGAVLLALMPLLTSDGRGLRGLYGVTAALGLAGLLCARWLGQHQAAQPLSTSTPPSGHANRLKSTITAIACAWLFNIVVGGLWSFVGEYAQRLGLAQADTDMILTLATLVGLAGAACAFTLSHWLVGRWPLGLGTLGILLGAAVLHLASRVDGFAAGCHLLSFSWNFSVPFLWVAVAAKDRSGRLVSSMNLAFALGLATGPLAAGWVIQTKGLDTLFPLVALCLALVALLTQTIA